MNLDVSSVANSTHGKIIHSMMRIGTLRNKKTLYNLAKKGKIVGVRKEGAIQFIHKISTLMKVLDTMYGDKWEFTLTRYYLSEDYKKLVKQELHKQKSDAQLYESYIYNYAKESEAYDLQEMKFLKEIGIEFFGYSLKVIIHYPKVTIVNKNNTQHSIKNLFITMLCKFRTTKKGKLILTLAGLNGFKSYYTYEEYNYMYCHSHLKSATFKSESVLKDLYFCTGSSDYGSVTMQVESDFCRESLMIYFHFLNSMVHWESLDGNPYRKIEQLAISAENSKKYNSVNFRKIKEFIHEYKKLCVLALSSYKETLNISNLNIILQNDNILIKADKNLESYLKKVIKDLMPEYDIFIGKRDIEGNFYKEEFFKPKTRKQIDDKITHPNGEKPHLFFRGEKYEIFIEEYKGEIKTPKEEDYIIHPKVIRKFKESIEILLHENYIANSTFRGEN